MGVMKRAIRRPAGASFNTPIPGKNGYIRYGMVLDESWQELHAIMRDLKKNVRTRVARKAVRAAADSVLVPAIKRHLIGITKRRSRGRGVQADLTRSWAKGLKRKNIKRSRVNAGVLIYAPTRKKLESLMRGRYKARYRGYPPAHVEFGAQKNVSPTTFIKKKDGEYFRRISHKRKAVRKQAPMKTAAIRAQNAYLNQMGRHFLKELRAEFRKKQRSGLTRSLRARGVKIPRNLR